jgi:YD repeat-containing protein
MSDVSINFVALGRPTGMDDSLGHTTWVFDNLDRVTEITDPFNKTVSYFLITLSMGIMGNFPRQKMSLMRMARKSNGSNLKRCLSTPSANAVPASERFLRFSPVLYTPEIYSMIRITTRLSRVESKSSSNGLQESGNAWTARG